MRAVALVGLYVGLSGLVTSEARAQDAGWDLAVNPEGSLTQASVTFEDGRSLVVQCLDGALDVVVIGVPAGPARQVHRSLESGPAGRVETVSWQTDRNGTSLIHPSPARAARGMRRIGTYTIHVPAWRTVPAHRVEFPLPDDSAGLDQTLAACGKPTINPRDDLPTVDEFFPPQWGRSRMFRAGHPARGGRRANHVEAQLTCIVAPRGRVEDCEIEWESPPDLGFGAAVLADAPNVRLDLGGHEAEAVGRVLRLGVSSTRRR